MQWNLAVVRVARRLGWLLLAVWSMTVNAQDDPLVGLWKVLDEHDGKPRALIRIVQRGGEFVGTIEKALRPETERSPTCDKCPGERRGQPLLGMAILTGMKKDGRQYRGGEILDPDSGATYDCLISLRDGGERLELRGFVGTPMIGRSQIWERVDVES